MFVLTNPLATARYIWSKHQSLGNAGWNKTLRSRIDMTLVLKAMTKWPRDLRDIAVVRDRNVQYTEHLDISLLDTKP